MRPASLVHLPLAVSEAPAIFSRDFCHSNTCVDTAATWYAPCLPSRIHLSGRHRGISRPLPCAPRAAYRSPITNRSGPIRRKQRPPPACPSATHRDPGEASHTPPPLRLEFLHGPADANMGGFRARRSIARGLRVLLRLADNGAADSTHGLARLQGTRPWPGGVRGLCSLPPSPLSICSRLYAPLASTEKD
jgi:hypothetical protein